MRRAPTYRRIVLSLLLLFPLLATADYLEIKRPAHLKEQPATDADTVVDLTPPVRVTLIEDGQTNGYYHVRTDSGETGWVYRTMGRRYRGDANGASGGSTSTNPSFALRRNSASSKSGACAQNLDACGDTGCADPEDEPEHAVLNRLKHGEDADGHPLPTSGSPITLSFAQLRALQRKVKSVPVGQGTELTKEDRNSSLHNLALTGGVTVSEGNYVQVVGYVAADRNLEASGGESVNCRLTKAAENDIHIPIVQHDDDDQYKSVVVEPIPQARPAAWSVSKFRSLQEDGKQLMIRGFLLYDNQHKVRDDPEFEEGLTNQPKRFTLWEVHPVKEVYECTRPSNKCSPSDMTQWKQIK